MSQSQIADGLTGSLRSPLWLQRSSRPLGLKGPGQFGDVVQQDWQLPQALRDVCFAAIAAVRSRYVERPLPRLKATLHLLSVRLPNRIVRECGCRCDQLEHT